jgi:hypothetical protein
MTRPITPKPNGDHWGFYQVGDLKTYSKIEAIDFQGRLKKPLVFKYNDEIFGRYDWKTDPPGNLKYWFKQRAEQLRNAYDYIVLLYSGGADSFNILNSFVENNIFLDEIAQFTAMEGINAGKDDPANFEVFAYSAPMTQRLIQSNPLYSNTKHRIVDGAQYQVDQFLNSSMFDLWYKDNSVIFSSWGRVMGGLKHYVPDYKRLVAKGKKVCLLWGWEKPAMSIDKNLNVYIHFADGPMQGVFTPAERTELDPNLPNDEAFYWTPDLPELLAKQAHSVKSFLIRALQHEPDGINLKLQEKKTSIDATQVFDPGKSPLRFTYHSRDLEISKECFLRLIYPWYFPELVYDGGKPGSYFFSDKDNWLWNTNVPELQSKVKLYSAGVLWLKNHVIQNAPELWWEKSTKLIKGKYQAGIAMSRKTYCIGNL